MKSLVMKNISHAIAEKINANIAKLNNLQAQITSLQYEMEQFLAQYFANISKHLPQYLLSNHLLNNPSSQSCSVRPSSKDYAINFDQLLKQLYRTLAKHFHPDYSNNNVAFIGEKPRQQNNANMQHLNAAYAQKQLGSLLLIGAELDLRDNITTHSLDDLLHYHQLLQTTIIQAEQELAQIQQSDVLKLKRNILLARLHGYDMMTAIAVTMKYKYQQKEYIG